MDQDKLLNMLFGGHFLRAGANREGAVGSARGGRGPHFL
jgi:hypothetical protein